MIVIEFKPEVPRPWSDVHRQRATGEKISNLKIITIIIYCHDPNHYTGHHDCHEQHGCCRAYHDYQSRHFYHQHSHQKLLPRIVWYHHHVVVVWSEHWPISIHIGRWASQRCTWHWVQSRHNVRGSCLVWILGDTPDAQSPTRHLSGPGAIVWSKGGRRLLAMPSTRSLDWLFLYFSS